MGKLKHILIGTVIVAMTGALIAVNVMLGDSKKRETLDTANLAFALETLMLADGVDSSLRQALDRLVAARKPTALMGEAEQALYEQFLHGLEVRAASNLIQPLRLSSSDGEALTLGEEIVARVFESLTAKHREQAGNIMRRGILSIGATNYFLKSLTVIEKEREQ